MGSSTARSLEDQLELWSELAKTLEGKLDKKTNELERLRRKAVEKDAINQDLRETVQFQTARIADLEQQCIARSSKLSQLAQVMTAQKTNEMQEKLVQKSLQVAELEEHLKRVQRSNVELGTELGESNLVMNNMRKDREKNNRLLLQLSDIVRTLNRIAIDYQKVSSGDGGGGNNSIGGSEDGSGTTTEDPQNQSLQNVKRKIEAIDRDRQQLVHERDGLKDQNETLQAKIAELGQERDAQQEENVAMQAKIDAFESSFQSMNQSRGDGTTSQDNSIERPKKSPKRRLEEAMATPEEDEDRSSVGSLETVSSRSSSSSTVHPPPKRQESGVSLKEHERLKNAHDRALQKNERIIDNQKQLQSDFDKALDVIEKLRNELAKRKSSLQSLQGSKTLADDLQRDLNQALDLNQAQETEMRNLQTQLDETRKAHQDALQNNVVLKRESDSQIAELKEMREHLQRQYQDLETEYTMKIEALENRVVEVQKEQERLLAEEKQASQHRLDTTVLEHQSALGVQRQLHDDLKREYDTFLEIHLKAEDDAKSNEKRYQETLAKVVSLESELLETKETMGKNALEHQESLAKSVRATQEAARRLQKVKKDFNLSSKELEKTKQEATEKQAELKRGYESNIARHRRQRDDAIRSYKELRKEFDSALVEHGKQLQRSKDDVEKLKRQNERAVTELLQSSQQSSSKRMEVVQSELQRKLEQSRLESHQHLEKLQAESKKVLDDLQSENRELREKLKEREDAAAAKNKEILSSYTCALAKIESLMKAEKTIKPAEKSGQWKKSGSKCGKVSERIKHFEQKAFKGGEGEKMPTIEKKTDDTSTFQRDFEAIVQRLAHDDKTGSTEQSLEADSTAGSTSSSCVSISLDAVLTPETADKAVTATRAVQTEIHDRALHGDAFSVLRHALLWSQVNSSFYGHQRVDSMTGVSVVSIHDANDLLAPLLLHIGRLRGVKASLSQHMALQGKDTKISDCNADSKTPKGGREVRCPWAIDKARIEVERLHGERLRQKIHLNAANIKSQARVKDFRLLELQYKSLREQYEQVSVKQMVLPIADHPSIIHPPSQDSNDGSSKLHPTGLDLSSGLGTTCNPAEDLRQQLFEAEEKLKETKRELNACNSQLKMAQKEQEEEDQCLMNTFERIDENDSWSTVPPPTQAGSTEEKSVGKMEEDQSTNSQSAELEASSVHCSDDTAVIRGDHGSLLSSEQSFENREHSPVNSLPPSSVIQSITTEETSCNTGASKHGVSTSIPIVSAITTAAARTSDHHHQGCSE